MAQRCANYAINRLKRRFNALFRLLRYNSAAMEYKRLTKEEFTLGYPPEKIYITSDLHLFHTNIIKYCGRPFDYSPKGCAEMTEFLLKKFDALPDDCLIWNFDDVYLNAKMERAKIMNAVMRMKRNRKMNLILGNHDFRNDKRPFKTFIEFYTSLGFDNVYKGPLLFGDYVLSHEPVFLDKKSARANIHGHTHQTFVTKDYFMNNWYKSFPKRKVDPSRYKNVCMDSNGFELLRLSDVMERK